MSLIASTASLFKTTATYDPIEGLLNCGSKERQDELTQRWKDNKLSELNFIGVVGALLASMLTTTGSWPAILSNGKPSPWTARACWYCGLILALSAVLTALQQSIRLQRLACHEFANAHIRHLLRKSRPGKDGRWKPRATQMLTWQLSSYLLSVGVLAMLVGLFILIWESTGNQNPSEPWWNSDSKLAVTFTIVSAFVSMLLLAQQVTLYSLGGEKASNDCHDM